MFLNIFLFILLFLISLIPIVGWGYLFTYFDDSEFNRNRFFVGILAGIISVFPILYLGDFFQKTNISFLNPFYYMHSFDGFLSIFPLLGAFFGILFILSIIPFLIFNIKYLKQNYLVFLKNYGLFGGFLVLFGIFVYILNSFFGFFSNLDFSFNSNVYFLDIAFNSLKLVIFYYLMVGILEELSKYFSFNYSKYFSITDVRHGVLYSIFIALGFGFVENILYLRTIYENSGMGFGLVGTYFSRNIFSLMLHVLCSSIFSYFFSQAYLKFKFSLNLEFLKMMFIGFFLSVFFHSLFDIFLTFRVTLVVFLYLIFGYFYLTYIFYRE